MGFINYNCETFPYLGLKVGFRMTMELSAMWIYVHLCFQTFYGLKRKKLLVAIPFAITACTQTGLSVNEFFHWAPLALWLHTNTHHSTEDTSQPHFTSTDSKVIQTNTHMFGTNIHTSAVWTYIIKHIPEHATSYIVNDHIQPGSEPGGLLQPTGHPAIYPWCKDKIIINQ